MRFAVEFWRVNPVAGFVMLLLEPKDERYVKAARELAKEAGGRVMDVDPQELARTLLKTFEGPSSTAIDARRS